MHLPTLIRSVRMPARSWAARAALTWACALAFVSPAPADPGPSEAMLDRQGLLHDVDLLQRIFSELHPGLYRYRSPAEVESAFGALRSKLAAGVDLKGAFLAFSEFTSTLQCGHTHANPFNQEPAVVERVFKGRNRLPFYFRWLDGEMVVIRDFTPGHVLPVGTVVSAIDGVPTRTVLEKLLTITRADGPNPSKRRAQLEVCGDSKFEVFDLYYPLFFPPLHPRFLLSAAAPLSPAPAQIAVDPVSSQDRAAEFAGAQPGRGDTSLPLFQWEVLPGRIALLRMPTWALYNVSWDWKGWLDRHLSELATGAYAGFIIDIRGNEGGDDVGNEILPYLASTPFHSNRMARLVRYRTVPGDLRPFLDTWDPSFLTLGKDAPRLETRLPGLPEGLAYYRLSDDASFDIAPRPVRFRGPVAVLIDANNSSATFQFADCVKANHVATLVGQQTGGSVRGINGGCFFFVRLPASHIEIDLPLVGTFPEHPVDGVGGVEPDVAVGVTAADIAAGRDPVLLRAAALLTAAAPAATP